MNRSSFGGSEFGTSNGFRSNGFGGGDGYKRYGGGSSFGGGGGQRNGNNSFESAQPPPNWATMDLKPFEKNFYSESQSIKSRPKEVTTNFLRTNNVKVNSQRFLDPILSFSELTLPRAIENKIQELRYANPTPIQSLCWPTLLSGLNMVGIAQTGSGKTLGFVIPMVMHILNNQRYARSFDRGDAPGPVGVVLAPTRELALQIQQVANEIGQLVGIKNVAIYGGASKGPQLSSIRRGADIYIATPGRLIDYVRERLVSLNKCTFLVLDEADRMLDMGFEPQIRKIIEQIRPDRLTAMFSATWPKEVRRLAEDFITDAVQINIGAQELRANPNIKQIVEVCTEGDKHMRLKNVLNEIMRNRDSKVIVFAETKKRVDSMSKFIQSLGYRCSSIHGDKKQSEREWVLNDIEDIKFVINVDYPMLTEDYVHRIGRTARSTNTGTAFTFVTSENARHMPKLIEILRDTNQEISEELMSMTRQFGGSRYGNSMGGRSRYPAKSSNFGGNSRFGNDGSYGSSNGYGNGFNGGSGGGYRGAASYENGGGLEAKKRGFSSVDGYNGSPSKPSDLNGGVKRARRWDDDWDSQPSSQNGNPAIKSMSNPYANDAPHSHSNGHSNGTSMAPPPLPTSNAPNPTAIMAMLNQAPYAAYY